MRYLLDTNVLSEVRKPNCDVAVKAWLDAVPPDALFLSVLVVGEIRQGIERLRPRDAPRAAMFDAWLVRLLAEYTDRILPITVDVADAWGRWNAASPMPVVDGLLAATAHVGGLVLVTRNTKDVERTGVRVENPFDFHAG